VENHGFFCQDSDRVEKLYCAVGHPNFGLLADMGNFLCADEAPGNAFSRVAPYAFYAHAKDFHVKSVMLPDPGEGFFRSRSGNYLRGAIIGHGDVPVRHCLTALKKAGYDGYIAIEFEGIEEPVRGIAIGLANLRRYLKEIE
jgi:sugar phosphate isomerase/epimerase